MGFLLEHLKLVTSRKIFHMGLFEVQLQMIQTQIRIVLVLFLFCFFKLRISWLWCREGSGLVIRRYRLYSGLEVFATPSAQLVLALASPSWLL